jgi:hypothetical protein
MPPDPHDPTAALAAAVARVADLIESRIAPSLDRIAAALEAAPSRPAAAEPSGRRAEALAEVRLAMAAARWDHAETLAEAFAREFPDDPEAVALPAQVARGRAEAIDALRSRLDASRQVNDPDSVIALHDELVVLLRGDARRELEREVVRWLINLLQRRMRAGTVRPDVVELATRVADRFGTTAEGASVRASLPTLRRSAGLCARCGAPYTGIEDACPRCLAAAAAAPVVPADRDLENDADADEEIPPPPDVPEP